MTSNYMPIPTDSDDEGDNRSMAANMSDYDGESDRSRSPMRRHYFGANPQRSDSEEEPEEDSPDRHPSPMSHIPVPPPGPRGRTRRTARKSVPIPIQQQWTRSRSSSPEPPTPATDPYQCNFRVWGQTLSTLQKWRMGGQYVPIPTGEEPSAIRQEFLLDTTPIIVNRLVRQEDRIDMLEDGIMEMPTGDMFGNLQDQVNVAEENISVVNDNTQTLKARLESVTRKLENMESSMIRMEEKTDKCQALAYGMIAQEAYEVMPRDFYKKKKDNEEE